MTRTELIEQLRQLPDEDLARLFYEALEPRSERHRYTDGSFTNTVYVIGTAVHTDSGPAEIEVLACALDPNEPYLVDVKGRGALEQGRCPVCATQVTCTSKVARCPICNAAVECT